MAKAFGKYKSLIILLGICVVVYAAGLLTSWFVIEKPNEFGDTAGAINGLFSALAFAGVIYAIFMQRDELEMQRKELSDQKEEFKTQNVTLKRQRFENTFFNMLQLLQQVTDNISYSYTRIVENENFGVNSLGRRYKEITIQANGRDAFRISFEEAPHSSSQDTRSGMRGLLSVDGIAGYEDSLTPTYFDHYFRLLYRIIKFVDSSRLIEDEDRYEYSSMVRAQLSRYELIWLYYNGLSCYGNEKFKRLIETYSLLKNLRTEMLVKDLPLKAEYSPSAFRHAN